MANLHEQNRINLVDSHCHLLKDYFNDLDAVLERAVASGIHMALIPGYDLATSNEALKLSLAEDWILAATGVHPTAGFESVQLELRNLESLLKRKVNYVSAIGETGIDLYHSTDRAIEQIELFSGHLKLCDMFDKPVIIHSRNSANVVVDTLKKCQYNGRGIFHCYDGSETLLDFAREKGFGVSFAGNVTYPNATLLRKMLEETPDELVLVETDSPFLAPKPFRGRRSEPAYIVHTLQAVAEVKNWTLEYASKVVRANFIRIIRVKE